MPTSTAYHVFIDQLLRCNTVGELHFQFQKEDKWLTIDLIQFLTERSAEAEIKVKYIWIIAEVRRAFGYKCLKNFIALPFNEAAAFAQDHIHYLSTQATYNYLDSLIEQFPVQSEEQTYLKEYQGHLAWASIRSVLLSPDWPEQRAIYLNGLCWLIHPTVEEFLVNLLRTSPELTDIIESVRIRIRRCTSEGVEAIVKEGDVDWLRKRSEESGDLDFLRQAIHLLSNEKDQKWASLSLDLGNAYRSSTTGGKRENLESAIAAYKDALEVYTLVRYPAEWATVKFNLGNVYEVRTCGEKADNLEEAINAYEQAMLIYTQEVMPYQWAMIQSRFGIVYRERIHGVKSENLEIAIGACNLAFQVFTYQKMPFEWAMVQNILGSIFSERIVDVKTENLEIEINAYKNALLVYTRQDSPNEWAMTQHNLGRAYNEYLRIEKIECAKLAIDAYEQALTVYTLQDSPNEWAMIQNGLGEIYCNEIQGNKAENMELAIQAANQALLVYTYQSVPRKWAQSQLILGAAYGQRTRGKRDENLENAISATKKALQVFTRQDMPTEWVYCHNILGSAYTVRVRGDRAENLELGIMAYEKALSIRTQVDMPYEWGMIHNNLGVAYNHRIRGEKAENLEKAIQALKLALAVRNREEMPYLWAMTQNNLGIVYHKRIHGDPAENKELAIQAYLLALEVRTQKDFPVEWAMTQNNLGTVYFERSAGDLSESQELGIKAYKCSLEVVTQKRMPYDWAMTQNNVGKAYFERIKGERPKNLELAIQAYRMSLVVRTKDTFPLECRQTSLNLGDLFYEIQDWQNARMAYQQAHEALELILAETLHEESRSKLAGDNAWLYSRLIHCCLLLDDRLGAVNYALAGKSRTLSEQLAGERKVLKDLLEDEPTLALDYAPIEKLRNELDELLALLMLPLQDGDNRSTEEIGEEQSYRHTCVNRLRNEINRLLKDLVFTYPALSAITQIPSLTLAEAQDLAAKLGNIPLVEYVCHAGGWGAFVISPTAVAYVPLKEAELNGLEESLALFLKHSADGKTLFWEMSDALKHLRNYYLAAFKPLLPYLPPHGEVVIAPTEILHLIPFQALISEDAVFLSEIYAFTFTPSLATLRVLYEQQQRTQIGAPVPNRVLCISHSGGNDSYLKNVSLEAQAVSTQFADSTEISEEEATLERVIAETNKRSYQVVHVSCHGNFLPESPLHSGLFIAGQKMLTVNDIRVRIRLKDRPLVSLSACQTGQTLPQQGDETTGISWAFLAAGASSVVASQWSVPDDSTRELFSHFYRIRNVSTVSDAEALRQAMKKVREIGAYANRPEYWAGFHIMGLPKSEKSGK